MEHQTQTTSEQQLPDLNEIRRQVREGNDRKETIEQPERQSYQPSENYVNHERDLDERGVTQNRDIDAIRAAVRASYKEPDGEQ